MKEKYIVPEMEMIKLGLMNDIVTQSGTPGSSWNSDWTETDEDVFAS